MMYKRLMFWILGGGVLASALVYEGVRSGAVELVVVGWLVVVYPMVHTLYEYRSA
jgi:hypothetical protein